jgi:hypothetical protein
MRFNLYIFSLLLSISACTSKSFRHRDLSDQSLQKTSLELEHSIISCSLKESLTPTSETATSSRLVEATNPIKPEVTKEEIVRYSRRAKEKALVSVSKKRNPTSVAMDDPLDEKPDKFNRDNIFWKIGRTLIRIGGGSFAVFGSLLVSLSVSRNSSYFFLSGILVSLAFILLSIPFFLIGIVAEIMKRNAKPPLENPNEI